MNNFFLSLDADAHYYQIYSTEGGSLEVFREYSTGACIRALAWVPSGAGELIVGSINGNVDQLILGAEKVVQPTLL